MPTPTPYDIMFLGCDDMKILKNSMFTFILGAIIFSTITALAISGINANQITYTDKNNTDTTVNLALDKLYNNLDSRIIMNTFGEAQYATSYGDRIANRTATINLNKGKYLLIDTKAFDFYHTDTIYPSAYENTNNSGLNYKNLSCSSSNCTINYLGGYYNRVRSSSSSDLGYQHVVGFTITYYVEIKENNDTISAYINDGVTTYNGEYETLIAIPINEN